VITARRTRLVRVQNLHSFRQILTRLAFAGDSDAVRSRAVLVPTRSAALRLSGAAGDPLLSPAFVTREEFQDLAYSRLSNAPPCLSTFERDVIMQAAGREAASAGAFCSPDKVTPGLVEELIRFYDQLRRQGKSVRRCEELVEERLSTETDDDPGAARMLAQTRFLAAVFRGYERRISESGLSDEHTLRQRLLSEPSADPIRHIVVSVGDWIGDPNGLYPADFDLLTRLPGAETIDLLATDRALAAGFHQRLHDWLPGIEEIDGRELDPTPMAVSRPVLLVPNMDVEPPVFVARDREEELIAIARRIKASPAGQSLDRIAVVFKRPLPYLYLAREVFGSAALQYHATAGLPLAAEPFAAALDLVFDFVESGFTRESVISLLRSPHFVFRHDGRVLAREAVAALDRALSEARYLGGAERLIALASMWKMGEAAAPVQVAREAADRLSPLLSSAPASSQLQIVLSFVHDYGPGATDEHAEDVRVARGRSAVLEVVEALQRAHARHDDAPIAIGELATSIRRNIEKQTFEPETGSIGVQLVDDQAARYGDFDDIAMVGLIDREWPERPRRNIFFPPALLTALGWPSEKDRRAADEAQFLDLIESASLRVSVSTMTLDDEALVEPSAFVDEIARARLTKTVGADHPIGPVFTEDALALDTVDFGALDGDAREWAEMRVSRSSAAGEVFHGRTGSVANRPWSVSALETYIGCPFKFFAQHVLRLQDEPEDEEVMDPRSEGEFVHQVFQAFFERWQADGRQAITPANLDTARAVFAEVVEDRLTVLSETEAALERSRLLGSPAAAGLGDAVLRMEAERPVPVVGRLLEHRLEGSFTFATADGARSIALRGKADRVDLLDDGTFRLIDYKLGWPPNKGRALQLPIYGLCAEQRLDRHLGRKWVMGEAAYIAFKGPKRVVPLFGSSDERGKVLADAQERLVATIDAIDRGEFPPRPDDEHRCETCTYAAVCRKDYVGDV
jgi:RecB family exonuclease